MLAGLRVGATIGVPFERHASMYRDAVKVVEVVEAVGLDVLSLSVTEKVIVLISVSVSDVGAIVTTLPSWLSQGTVGVNMTVSVNPHVALSASYCVHNGSVLDLAEVGLTEPLTM